MTWPDRYLVHFTRYFGKPFDVQVYRREDGAPLRLATFDQRFKKYRIYACLGLSEEVATLHDRGEVILLADDLGKDIPLVFVNSLFFVLQRRIKLGSRFALGGLDNLNPDFADEFDKASLYFTLADGFGEGFERVEYQGEVGTVFQALFISWAEHDFLNRKGADEFEKRLREYSEDLCSLKRPSCV